MTVTRSNNMVHVASALGAMTREPFVEITTVQNGEVRMLQVSPEEAREIARKLFECAEAADMDAIVIQFVMQKVNVPFEKAAQVLLEFREIRDELRKTKGEGA